MKILDLGYFNDLIDSPWIHWIFTRIGQDIVQPQTGTTILSFQVLESLFRAVCLDWHSVFGR